MIIYAIVNDYEKTDGVPALFLYEEEAQKYADKLNESEIEDETYVVVSAIVMGDGDECP